MGFGYTQKPIEKVKSHTSHQLKHYSSIKPSRGQSFTCFRVFGASGHFGETGLKQSPNTQKHGQKDTESNLKFSTYHFTSNKALLKCNDHLKVKFHIFHGCSNHSNLEMEAECLTKTLSYLNLNISRTKNRNKL